jgi:hypothetical protein
MTLDSCRPAPSIAWRTRGTPTREIPKMGAAAAIKPVRFLGAAGARNGEVRAETLLSDFTKLPSERTARIHDDNS